ncbi:MAG: tetratricopeptide repeat protein [Verrucomicrobiota bacterium]|nr:tetratricopeptide repeat protein [Verrucomicrobiota bacterium]
MAEPNPEVRLEIAHVLFIDVVGSSKLLINEQSDVLRHLNEIVRNTAAVRAAEATGKLIRLPTGDGMALAFFTTPDAPARCAMEIASALRQGPQLQLRMGINSGPVEEIVDVNDRSNVTGAGITVAQRVMDCGDAGHILLSQRAGDDLAEFAGWRSRLHALGPCEVKHGVVIDLINLYTDEIGNAAPPAKLRVKAETTNWRARSGIRIAALIGLLLLLGIGAWLYSRRPAPGDAASQRIAVLPFKPLLPENRDQVLELGMADTLIAKLSSSTRVIVSSLNAVRKFGGLDQDAIAAGKELQVASVLEGSVQRVGDRIRVTARLIKVADGASLWAGTFDEKFTDVFSVQDDISQKVSDALALRLSGEEQKRLTRRYTNNLAAYQLYLTGRYQWSKLTPLDIRKSIEFFQQAIAADPNYALAYFGLAEAYRSLAITSNVPSRECLPQAKAAAEKALAIDPLLAEAHASLSFCLVWYDWNWAEGMREAQRAIALNPNSAHAHFAYAHVLSDMGRHDEAIAEIKRARELDPVFLLYAALEGMMLHHAGRNDEALLELTKAIDLDSNFWITHLQLGKIYTQQRKYTEAIAEFVRARDLSHGNSEAIASIGYAAAMAGDRAKTEAVLNELKTSSSQRYVAPASIALVYNALGDRNEAVSWLNKACEERDVWVTLLKVDPRWDSLRADAGFAAVLKRIGLL